LKINVGQTVCNVKNILCPGVTLQPFVQIYRGGYYPPQAAVARLPLRVYGSGILLAQLSEKITNNYKWLQFTKIQLSRADYYTHFPHGFQQLLKKNGNAC
jgi:hypothetical protein